MIDTWTDAGRTYGRENNVVSHTLTMKGSDVGSLIEFRPVV